MAGWLNSCYMYYRVTPVKNHTCLSTNLIAIQNLKSLRFPLIRYHINDAHKNGLSGMRKAPSSILCKGEKIIQKDFCS